ncbi:MAG: hypothetical protein AKCLJLPJ_02079 [Fimbriimonadales bacterium]|nr:hypothetical protein [Fimbriimonadales bacterium]
MKRVGGKWLAVGISLAFSLAWGLQVSELGGKLRKVNDQQARDTSGYGVSGVAVDSVDTGGLLDYFGLRAKDVLLDVNGVRTLAEADVQRAFRPKDDANTMQFSRDGRKWMLSVLPATTKRVAFVVPPELVDDPDNPYKTIALNAGVVADFSPTLPREFSTYAAIVLVNPQTATPNSVAGLREYLRKGGGVLLTGVIPYVLAGQSSDYDRADLASIADWFGAAHMWRAEASGHQLTVRANRAFGSAFRSGESLYTPAGEFPLPYLRPRDLSPDVVPVAEFSWDDYGDQVRMVMALSRKYGEGRVAYCFTASDPAWPKLQELFIAAVRWCAKLNN